MFTYKQGFFLRTIAYSEMKSTPLIVRSICYVNSLTSNIMKESLRSGFQSETRSNNPFSKVLQEQLREFSVSNHLYGWRLDNFFKKFSFLTV